jgi:hypothetical protein
MSAPTTIRIDEVEYVRADSIAANAKPAGPRAIVVVDRGWIFAGDVTEKDGRIILTRAIHVMRWESIGFDGMVKDPKGGKVTLRAVPDVDLPSDSEIFRVPVVSNWGL